MADFEPQAVADAPQVDAVQAKSKGNKLTRNTSHPVAIIVYAIFKLYPLVFGIVDLIISLGMMAKYIAYAIGISFEFYNTKNFAGRFLGKLRWHTYIVEGKQYFYFESMLKDGQSKLDNIVFWSGLWFSVVYFIALVVAYIFTLQFFALPIVIVGAIAGFVNLAAYIKCSNDAKKKMKEFGQKAIQKGVQMTIENQMQQ